MRRPIAGLHYGGVPPKLNYETLLAIGMGIFMTTASPSIAGVCSRPVIIDSLDSLLVFSVILSSFLLELSSRGFLIALLVTILTKMVLFQFLLPVVVTRARILLDRHLLLLVSVLHVIS